MIKGQNCIFVFIIKKFVINLYVEISRVPFFYMFSCQEIILQRLPCMFAIQNVKLTLIKKHDVTISLIQQLHTKHANTYVMLSRILVWFRK